MSPRQGVLAILLLSAGLAVSAVAADAGPGPLAVHTLKFYLHPSLVTDAAFARTMLPKYVADMNHILAKNTRRRFAFDPETGIVLTETKPQTDSYFTLPATGFEVWAHVSPSTSGWSWGGYMGADMSGAGALADLHWHQIYDPDQLAPSDRVNDYWRQINAMIHEFGHIFGAGAAEYYDVITADDTGELPTTDISLQEPGNPYFTARPDLVQDPMLTMPSLETRQAYLDTVRYSELTAATLNGEYRWPVTRPPLPDYEHLRLRLRHHDDGSPVAGARVEVWRVHLGNPAIPTQRLAQLISDENGLVIWSWLAESVDALTTDSIRMLKIRKDGYEPASHPVTFIDLSRASVVEGRATLEETVLLDNRAPRLTRGGPGQLRITGAADTAVALEQSSDLANWTNVSTHRLAGGAVEVAVTAPDAGDSRFYRARVVTE